MSASPDRSLPADAAIYAEYVRQLAAGRGAYARAARVLGCSDEHVRHVKLRHEAKRPMLHLQIVPKIDNSTIDSAETDNSLGYIPAPGELAYQEACRRIAQEHTSEIACKRDAALLEALLSPPCPPVIPVVMSPQPLPTLRQCQRSELTATAGYDFVANRRRAQNVAVIYAWAVFLLWCTMPPALQQLLLPVMLGCWVVAVEHGGI